MSETAQLNPDQIDVSPTKYGPGSQGGMNFG
jgi:hypothetical protein